MIVKIINWVERIILSDGNKRQYTEDGKYWISGNGFGVNTDHPDFLKGVAKTISKFDKTFNKGKDMKIELGSYWYKGSVWVEVQHFDGKTVGLKDLEHKGYGEEDLEYFINNFKPKNEFIDISTLDNHFNNFTQWSTDRKIIQNGNVLAQGLKLVSEVGELADNLAKGRCIKDDIGDCCVVLNNLVHMQGLTLDECLEQAWQDIKNRTGSMNEHGVFIKDADIEK